MDSNLDTRSLSIETDLQPIAARQSSIEIDIEKKSSRECRRDRSGWEKRLNSAVAATVVPRLIEAHRNDPVATPNTVQTDDMPAAQAARFAEMVVAGDEAGQWRFLTGLAADMGLEAIYLDVMTPAMRRINELWNDDRMRFAEMTERANGLQQMMRRLGAEAS